VREGGRRKYHDHKGSNNNNNDILTHENEGSQAALTKCE
jgi:hypothetical protein